MEENKSYSKYYIIRGNLALWKGDPAESGTKFRQVIITSNEWNSSQGTFQVYAIEGTSKGIQERKLAIADDGPALLFDEDCRGLGAARERCSRLIQEAEALGFKPVTLIDEMELQAKLRRA
jgi:hypothetical protein